MPCEICGQDDCSPMLSVIEEVTAMATKADRPLYADRDGNIVAAGDRRAAVQVASRAGKDIPEAWAKKAKAWMAENPRTEEDADQDEQEQTPQEAEEAAEEADEGLELPDDVDGEQQQADEGEKSQSGPDENKAQRSYARKAR